MILQILEIVFLILEVVEFLLLLFRSFFCVYYYGFLGVDLLVIVLEVFLVFDQIRGEFRGLLGFVNSRQKSYDYLRYYYGSSIVGGLVKGVLFVVVFVYKVLFVGLFVIVQLIVFEDQIVVLMVYFFEMGFCDRQLNLWLLKKYNYNILQVVMEFFQINNNDWYSECY